MDDCSEEENVYVFQGLGIEEIIVLVADTVGDGRREGFRIRARAFDRVRKVLHDELEFRVSPSEGYAGVTIRSTDLDSMEPSINTQATLNVFTHIRRGSDIHRRQLPHPKKPSHSPSKDAGCFHLCQ